MTDSNDKEGTLIGKLKGTVKYFKGTYGFIVADDSNMKDVFVHHSEVEPWREGFKELEDGQRVEFDCYKNSRGLNAKNVTIEGRERPVAPAETAEPAAPVETTGTAASNE